ncbi:MAG: M23 family metallopeptidase [Patescibacteria group bacterium]
MKNTRILSVLLGLSLIFWPQGVVLASTQTQTRHPGIVQDRISDSGLPVPSSDGQEVALEAPQNDEKINLVVIKKGIILSLPFAVESHWESVSHETPGIVWTTSIPSTDGQTSNQEIKFGIEDGKFISTNPQDTWFVYGWFGSIEAITKPYNIKYPQWNNRHNGIDFAGRLGLEIISASSGTVTFTGNKIGQTIEIDAGNNYLITYGHLQDITVSVGDRINAGDLIGHLGATGTINPHLHFEIDKIENGYKTAINPLTLLEADWGKAIIPDADANRFYAGPADPKLQPNFTWQQKHSHQIGDRIEENQLPEQKTLTEWLFLVYLNYS